MEQPKTDYVIVTAAFNEEKYIEKTICSVLRQTIAPKCWVIVSDGSSDNTDRIIKKYANENKYIIYHRKEKCNNRSYIGKANALCDGIKLIKKIEYSFYCTLDADVEFDEKYFEKIIEKFNADKQLGIAGGVRFENGNNKLIKEFYSPSSVMGSIQFFKKECFESTKGYIPSKVGAIDSIIEIQAKRNGWIARTFPELHVIHLRREGTEGNSLIKARFKNGIKDYCLGNSLSFEVLKCFYRIFEHPYGIGSVANLFGYLSYYITNKEKKISMEEISFIRKEQLKRVFKKLQGKKYDKY